MGPRIKRLLSMLLAFAMVFSLVVPAAAAPVAKSGQTVQLKVGQSANLKTYQWFSTTTWTSSDEDVATVSNGVVTAVGEGTAVITATSTSHFSFFGTKTTTYTVVVTDEAPDVEEDTGLRVEVGQTLQLEVVSNGGTTFWTSSDESIATVDGNGLVTGVAEGDVLITAKTTKTSGGFFGFFWWGGSKTTTTTRFEVKVVAGEAQPTEPTEPEPTETEPTETDPVETEPTETEPTEPEPTEPEVVTYTVTFDTKGGSEVDPVQVEEGATVSEPEDPVKDGCVFVGWYVGEEYEEAFLFDDDIIVADITLHAFWLSEDIMGSEDQRQAEAAVELIDIEYAQGDHSGHVTRDVGLASEVEGGQITWQSSSDTITVEGVVTRPQGNDEVVVLTAVVAVGEASSSVEFVLNVVHEKDRDPSEVTNNSVVELEDMNSEDDGFDIDYNDDKTQVISIDGTFSDIIVENADDALDVIYGIRTILGLDDPYEEMELRVINETEYGTSYTFDQCCNGYPVYARRVTVCVDAEGKTNSLSSGVCASSVIGSVDAVPTITAEEAEAFAVASYTEEVAADPESTTLIYYALNDHLEAPVLTYRVAVSGVDAEGEMIQDIVFVDSDDGQIIHSETQVIAAEKVNGSAKNEMGKKVSFPVAYRWLVLDSDNHYKMEDLDRKIRVYDTDTSTQIRNSENKWTDRTAVSAYTNTIATHKWYESMLGRDSLNGKGNKVKVVVHNTQYTNNAFWSSSSETLNYCDNSRGSSLSTTSAAALDVVAHEYTHGVVYYVTGGIPYENMTGAINEGYADIYGCLIDGDWLIGEDWRILRSASDPESYGDPSKMSSSSYIAPVADPNRGNDYGGVHTNGSLLYHAVYLMNSYGLSKNTIARLWYNALGKGFDGTSTYKTVRKNVIKAAREMRLSHEQIDFIQKAFNEVEIWGDRGTLNVTVRDTSDELIYGAVVTVVEKGIRVPENGKVYRTTLDEGEYTVSVVADGYLDCTARVEIEDGEMATIHVRMVRDGEGSVMGKVVSATSALALEGVVLNVRVGMNAFDGDIIATTVSDGEGAFSFDLDAGYYTIEMILDGYTTGYKSVEIEGGVTQVVSLSISPVMSSGTYRVVLTWGESPSDLDSHLTGTADDGTDFHVYYAEKEAYKADGTEIANLDVDDVTSYGPETITFTAETEGTYNYYVYRYSSSGSLPASSANVKVYNGERLVAEYNVDAAADSSLRYWNVFSITNGIFRTVDTVTSSPS